jgi:MurNAc alpha-1-phosphate uridylyltransferase
MKINTALILCAGFGKRVNPITTNIPKPLIIYKNITLLENAINLLIGLKIENVKINVFYLKEKIKKFIEDKKFPIKIEIIEDGETILGTGGGTLNLTNFTDEIDILVVNPDTIWNSTYLKSIIEMEKFYFNQKIKNVLLIVNNSFCFDKRFNGDFEFKDNILLKKKVNNFKYTGCQIINKEILANKNLTYFPMSEIWNNLERENKLYGFEYSGEFLHLTDIEIYNKLFISKNQ